MKDKLRQAKIYGLTGGISSGKSLAGEILSQWFLVQDADKMVHELYQTSRPLLAEIESRFGSGIMLQGELDRKSLRSLVFADPKALLDLNQIIRPYIRNELLLRIAQARQQEKRTVFLIPLLFENSWEEHLDYVLLVGCSDSVQLHRLLKRDRCSSEEAKRIMQAQMPLEEKKKHCQYYIHNDGSIDEFRQALLAWAESVV